MLSSVKTIIYIQMVATVMLLCKFGNYILSVATTGSNSALSCNPTQNITQPVIKEFKEQQDLGLTLTVWLGSGHTGQAVETGQYTYSVRISQGLLGRLLKKPWIKLDESMNW